MAGDILFTNANLLDPAEGVIWADRHVLVRGNRIAAISDGPSPADEHAQILDLGGRTLMPGLIDLHVHITAAHVNLAELARMPPSLVAAIASRFLAGFIERGFTTVRDAGGADLGLKQATERGLFPGPRLFIAGRAISQTGGHADFRDRVPMVDVCPCALLAAGVGRIADGVAEVRRAVRDELRLGADQIKVMADGGVASPTDPIGYLQYSTEELEAVVDEAARAHTYVMAHVYTPPGIRRCIDAGIRTVEHGNLIDDETAARMAERGAFMVPTLATYHALFEHGRELGLPEVSMAKLDEVLEHGARSIEIARRAGVEMGFGTDLLGELHSRQGTEFGLRAQVLSNVDVLRSATVVGAKVLRRDGELGAIREGALADLIVIDGNPLDDLNVLGGDGERVPLVMKDGRIMKDRLAPPA